MGFCGFAPQPYVQVKDPAELETAWRALLEKTDSIKTPEECATCEDSEFCQRCPGLLSSESGDPGKVSETFCSLARDMHRLYNELKARDMAENPEKYANQASDPQDGEEQEEKR